MKEIEAEAEKNGLWVERVCVYIQRLMKNLIEPR